MSGARRRGRTGVSWTGPHYRPPREVSSVARPRFGSSGGSEPRLARRAGGYDALGHAAGDSVLVAVGERITSVIRSTDFTARIGGDEFVVLLRGCELDDARRLAEAVAAAVASIPITLTGRPHQLGASIGLVRLSAGVTADAVLARADAACYAAKKAGRGRIVIAA